ncbi:MAG: cellulase family glycosylhydrolase, partial [Thermoguttaceae bacterium]|nr:cellulase family glycosylhydrolase [Thermoguttaceae bacterium]
MKTSDRRFQTVSRRDVLRVGAAAAAACLARQAISGQTPAAKRPSLHVYDAYGWLRGFSMVPSWGARIEEAWWSYHPDRMREEVALARQVHANCIRLWIEFTAWMADPDKVAASFLDAVRAIGDAGMKAMPCLFNRWHDDRYDYGGTYTETLFRNWQPQLEYVRTLVAPLADDPRVLAWDLCNEPQAHDLTSEVNQREFAWLTAVAQAVRAGGAKQPITIGTMTGKNIEIYAPLVDVLCAHPYAHDRKGLEGLIAGFEAVRKAQAKPLLVNECIPGSLNDATRAEVARFYTELLSAAGFGWMGWALREGKAISTRRDRYDANGVGGEGF